MGNIVYSSFHGNLAFMKFVYYLSLALISPLTAQTTTWVGDTSTSWGDTANWSDGVPGNTVTAIFDDPADSTFQPNLGSSLRRVADLQFNSAGWDISTGGGRLLVNDNVTSNGSGVNQVALIDMNNAKTVTTGAGNTFRILQDDSNSGGLIKVGTGIFEIAAGATAGDNFNNASAINAGGFLINGIYVNNDAVAVLPIANGAWLGGAGTFQMGNGGNLNFQSGSILAPGADGPQGSTLGTMTFDNTTSNASRSFSVNLQSGSSLSVDVLANGSSDSLSFVSSSSVNQTNTFNVASGVSLDLFGALGTGEDYTIATISGFAAYDGSAFSSVSLNGSGLTQGVDYTIAYNPHIAGDPGSGSIILTSNIPEPSTYVLLSGLAALCAIALRRKQGH